jgi:hypothetical protein
LDPVEEVKNLCPELQIDSFVDLRSLEEREVEVGDAVSAQFGIGTAFVSECESTGHREARGIEPPIQSRLSGPIYALVAATDHVGPQPRTEAS